MRRFLTYVFPYKRQLGLGVLLLLGTSLVDLAGPFIVGMAIDDYIRTRRPEGLLGATVLYLLVLIAGFVFRYLQTFVTGALGQLVMYDLRTQLFRHVQRLSLSFFDRNPVGRLVTRLTNDVDALNELLTSGIVAIIGDSFTLIGIAILMLYLNWQLALITFCVLPILVYASLKIQVRMRAAFRQTRLRLARINAFIAENVTGMQVVQLFNRERRNFDNFTHLNADYREATMRSTFYFALFFPIVGMISALAFGLIIWFGGGRVVAGAMSLGALVAFLQYVERFFLPIRDLSEKYNVLQSAMASSERIFRLLDEEEDVRDPERPVRLGTVHGEVEFDHVWFRYNEDAWVLRDVSFKVQPGESVAFVGATGAGKTSIISLMSRFYDVQKGRVLVDGVDVRDVAQAELRGHIGVVLQDPFLFSGTIASNIRLHNQNISDEQVRQAARYVNADAFIQRLPNGYDEEVRERGAGLSVGQKQLLSFARAIAFNPEIMLVLDEATSSVDTETEGLIQDALQKLMKGRTTFIIAHRLSTVQNVDRIIVLHKGRIVEQGNHQELLAQRGYYYRLYELQYRNQVVAG
ncbi:MAG: ABC transporter ATP-binding protein/permease [Chloroflexota bacterium]|nr:ABC transporter ATP-binding protein/permease [Chloroflexota bacterium]